MSPLRGIGTITLMTFREARRRRLVLTVALLGIVYLVLFTIGFYFVHKNAKFTIVGERRELPRRRLDGSRLGRCDRG
jgi:hypothetical protein